MSSRYYFDMRNGTELIVDDVGEVHSQLSGAQDEAALSLAHAIEDAVKTSPGALREIVIELRDEAGPVLHAKFMLQLLRQN